jgi:hypothetical protein
MLFQPVLRGINYWFRYGSLACSWHSMLILDFTRSFGPTANAILTPLFVVLSALGFLTYVLPWLANIWTWRRHRLQTRHVPLHEMPDRTWLRGYAIWAFIACIITNAASTEPAMWWHNLLAFHAAVLPLVFWTVALLRTRQAPLVRRALAAYLVLSVVLLFGMAFGSEKYRGRDPATFHAYADHEIVRDLGLLEWSVKAWPRKSAYFYQSYMRPFEIPPAAEAEAGETVGPVKSGVETKR